MLEAVFIDTWGWLALGHRRDARHREVRAFYQALQEEGALAIPRTTSLMRRSHFSSGGRCLRKSSAS